jgi:hypothetical protein
MVSLMLLVIIESLIELSYFLQICQCLCLLVFWIFFKTNKLPIDWIHFNDILRQALLSVNNNLGMYSSHQITTMLFWVSLFNQTTIDYPMKLLSITRQFF